MSYGGIGGYGGYGGIGGYGGYSRGGFIGGGKWMRIYLDSFYPYVICHLII